MGLHSTCCSFHASHYIRCVLLFLCAISVVAPSDSPEGAGLDINENTGNSDKKDNTGNDVNEVSLNNDSDKNDNVENDNNKTNEVDAADQNDSENQKNGQDNGGNPDDTQGGERTQRIEMIVLCTLCESTAYSWTNLTSFSLLFVCRFAAEPHQ